MDIREVIIGMLQIGEVKIMKDSSIPLNLQKRRLEEVFISLARKHKLEENEAISFLRELEEALSFWE